MAALADEVVAMEDLAEVMHTNMNTLEVRCSRCLPAPCTRWCLELGAEHWLQGERLHPGGQPHSCCLSACAASRPLDLQVL